MIRIATEADVPEILAIYAPYIENTTVTFEYDVPGEEAFLQRFREITEQFPWLVWEEGGKILGYAYGSAPFARDAYRWCAEDSVYLLPEARGRGIGTRLCSALEKVLFYQGYQRIYALITAENQASVDFHKSWATPSGATSPVPATSSAGGSVSSGWTKSRLLSLSPVIFPGAGRQLGRINKVFLIF